MAKDGKALVQVMAGTVKSVDWNKKHCQVELPDGRVFYKVRLRAVLDNSAKGLVFKPAKNSAVLIGLIENLQNSAFVCMVTELDAIEIKTDSDVLSIDVQNGEFVLNGGNNEGLVKVVQLTQKLNALEKDINTIKGVFNGWTPQPQDGGAALKLAAQTWAGSSLQVTAKADIENNKVKH
jgi:hypothetical protein